MNPFLKIRPVLVIAALALLIQGPGSAIFPKEAAGSENYEPCRTLREKYKSELPNFDRLSLDELKAYPVNFFAVHDKEKEAADAAQDLIAQFIFTRPGKRGARQSELATAANLLPAVKPDVRLPPHEVFLCTERISTTTSRFQEETSSKGDSISGAVTKSESKSEIIGQITEKDRRFVLYRLTMGQLAEPSIKTLKDFLFFYNKYQKAIGDEEQRQKEEQERKEILSKQPPSIQGFFSQYQEIESLKRPPLSDIAIGMSSLFQAYDRILYYEKRPLFTKLALKLYDLKSIKTAAVIRNEIRKHLVRISLDNEKSTLLLNPSKNLTGFDLAEALDLKLRYRLQDSSYPLSDLPLRINVETVVDGKQQPYYQNRLSDQYGNLTLLSLPIFATGATKTGTMTEKQLVSKYCPKKLTLEVGSSQELEALLLETESINLYTFSLKCHTYAFLQFQLVKQANTYEAYTSFIKNYPDRKERAEAEIRLHKLVLEINTLPIFQKFITDFPESKYLGTIKSKMNHLEFDIVRQTNTFDAYKDFLTRYPNRKERSQAELNLFNLVKAINSLEIYQRHLQDFPDSMYHEKVVNLLYKLEFDLVRQRNTYEGYANFIKKYADSKKRIEVEKLQFEFVKKINTRKILRRYLNDYENSSYRTETVDLLFKRIVEENRWDSYISFLKDFPNDNTQEVLKKLKDIANQKPADTDLDSIRSKRKDKVLARRMKDNLTNLENKLEYYEELSEYDENLEGDIHGLKMAIYEEQINRLSNPVTVDPYLLQMRSAYNPGFRIAFTGDLTKVNDEGVEFKHAELGFSFADRTIGVMTGAYQDSQWFKPLREFYVNLNLNIYGDPVDWFALGLGTTFTMREKDLALKSQESEYAFDDDNYTGLDTDGNPLGVDETGLSQYVDTRDDHQLYINGLIKSISLSTYLHFNLGTKSSEVALQIFFMPEISLVAESYFQYGEPFDEDRVTDTTENQNKIEREEQAEDLQNDSILGFKIGRSMGDTQLQTKLFYSTATEKWLLQLAVNY